MRRAADLRAFALRSRAAVQTEKEAYWVAWKHRHSIAEAMALADELRAQARQLRPDWPSAAERRDDLRHHLRVSELLRRVPPRGR